jgi:hypothetical protein
VQKFAINKTHLIAISIYHSREKIKTVIDIVKPIPLVMWITFAFMVSIVSCCLLIEVARLSLTGHVAVGGLLGSAIFSSIIPKFQGEDLGDGHRTEEGSRYCLALFCNFMLTRHVSKK